MSSPNCFEKMQRWARTAHRALAAWLFRTRDEEVARAAIRDQEDKAAHAEHAARAREHALETALARALASVQHLECRVAAAERQPATGPRDDGGSAASASSSGPVTARRAQEAQQQAALEEELGRLRATILTKSPPAQHAHAIWVLVQAKQTWGGVMGEGWREQWKEMVNPTVTPERVLEIALTHLGEKDARASAAAWEKSVAKQTATGVARGWSTKKARKQAVRQSTSVCLKNVCLKKRGKCVYSKLHPSCLTRGARTFCALGPKDLNKCGMVHPNPRARVCARA